MLLIIVDIMSDIYIEFIFPLFNFLCCSRKCDIERFGDGNVKIC